MRLVITCIPGHFVIMDLFVLLLVSFPGSRDPDVLSLSVLLQFSIKKSESVLQERQNKLDYYHEGCNIGYVMC